MIKQIGVPLRGRPIWLINGITTDQIGLHSVLLPSLISDMCFADGTRYQRAISDGEMSLICKTMNSLTSTRKIVNQDSFNFETEEKKT